jgi:hypothetical protein
MDTIFDPSLISALPLIAFMTGNHSDCQLSKDFIKTIAISLLAIGFVVSKKNLTLSVYTIVLVLMIQIYSMSRMKEGFSPSEETQMTDVGNADVAYDVNPRGSLSDVPHDTTFQYLMDPSVVESTPHDAYEDSVASPAPGSTETTTLGAHHEVEGFDWGRGSINEYEEF